jgi:hypothetical protein
MPRKTHNPWILRHVQQTTKKKVSPKIQFLLGWNGHPNMDLPINEDLSPIEVWKIIQDYIKRNNLLKDSKYANGLSYSKEDKRLDEAYYGNGTKYQFIYPDEKFAECFEVNKLLPLGIHKVSHLFYWKHNQFTIE